MWWQPWAALSLFAFLLNFVWEFLQVPAFEGLAGEPHWASILFCLQATVGDVIILAIAYGAVAVATGTRWWLMRPTARRVSVYVAVGLSITFVLEPVNVHLLERWSYEPWVPTVLGVGLPPILQWIVLPPFILWLARRHLAGARRAS